MPMYFKKQAQSRAQMKASLFDKNFIEVTINIPTIAIFFEQKMQ